MPTGERSPDGALNVFVEFLADVYTEAIKPMYAIVVGFLVAYCVVRLTMRFIQLRRQRGHEGPPRAGPDPPLRGELQP